MTNAKKSQNGRQAVRIVDRILFGYGPVSVERFAGGGEGEDEVER